MKKSSHDNIHSDGNILPPTTPSEEAHRLNIIVDTREQTPFLFFDYPCSTSAGTLHTGDYSVSGFESRILIERKSLADLASCMTSGRDRFERELERMRPFESACVIVEEPLTAIRHSGYRSNLNPRSFEQSILSFSTRYRVPFLFGHNRTHAEWLAFNVLRHFWNKNVPSRDRIPFVESPPSV